MELAIIFILTTAAVLAIETLLRPARCPHTSELHLHSDEPADPGSARLTAGDALFAVAPLTLGGAAVAVVFASPPSALALAAAACLLFALGRRRGPGRSGEARG
jgi:hypothetical protein